jgi:hypothetical protein
MVNGDEGLGKSASAARIDVPTSKVGRNGYLSSRALCRAKRCNAMQARDDILASAPLCVE